MSIITITSGKYTNSEETVKSLAEKLKHDVLTDEAIIEETAQSHNINPSILKKVSESKTIAFNDFTHEKEICIAALKKTLSNYVSKGNVIFHGIIGHLIPHHMTHVIRVLIIADKQTRINNGTTNYGVSHKTAVADISRADKAAALWINDIHGKKPWDETLYDIVIPADKFDSSEASDLIEKHSGNLMSDSEKLIARKEADDFSLASEAGMALVPSGSRLIVRADDGKIVITIDQHVMMLSRFKQKLKKIAEAIEGVKSVDVIIGQNFYKSNIIHNFEFETPLNVLLVDDEKEFVETLSDRLKMRQVNSDVVYSGEEALNYTVSEDTEVMVLDLKMPGIDGFEVLKQIKQTKPDMEVIILTGHGSEEDKKTCMDLGAFAYLQKPADIDLLTSTMKEAYEKINRKKQSA